MKLALDKQAHLWAGMAISFAVAAVSTPAYGPLAALVIGTGKEIYDRFHPDHSMELKDAVMTAAGGWLAYLWLLLVLP